MPGADSARARKANALPRVGGPPSLYPMAPPEIGRSRITIALAALAVIAACLLLGAWQFSRVYRPVDGYTSEPVAVPLDRLVPAGTAVSPADVARQVTVSGSYDARGQYLDPGHSLDGQVVSWVVTPLLLGDSTRVLVVRGWVSGPDASLALPPQGRVALTGRVQQGDLKAGGDEAGQRSGFLVRTAQTPPDPLSLQPVPSPPPDNGAPVEFHFQNAIYVAQWWFFAVLVAVSWWRLVRADGRRLRDEDEFVVAHG